MPHEDQPNAYAPPLTDGAAPAPPKLARSVWDVEAPIAAPDPNWRDGPQPAFPDVAVAAGDLVELSAGHSVSEADALVANLRGAGVRAVQFDGAVAAANLFVGQAVGGVKVLVHRDDVRLARGVTAAMRGTSEVFVVRQKPYGLYGVMGLCVGLLVGFFAEALLHVPLLMYAVALACAAWGVRKGWRGLSYCASCAKVVPAEATVCPGCHGRIAGFIAHANDRLAAEEGLRAGRQGQD